MDSIENFPTFAEFRKSSGSHQKPIAFLGISDIVQNNGKLVFSSRKKNVKNLRIPHIFSKQLSPANDLLHQVRKLNDDCLKVPMSSQASKNEEEIRLRPSHTSNHGTSVIRKSSKNNHAPRCFVTNFDINVISPTSW